MAIYRNDWFPLPQYRQLVHPNEVRLSENVYYFPYKKGIPLYSNRSYSDEIGNEIFEDAHVIQLPRHCSLPTRVEFDSPVIIYRFLSKDNDNSNFSDWNVLDETVKIVGSSCTHKIVVSKEFEPGVFDLESGGPVASSPILIRSLSDKSLNTLVINKKVTSDNFGFVNLDYFLDIERFDSSEMSKENH